jgi:hypothetical protein
MNTVEPLNSLRTDKYGNVRPLFASVSVTQEMQLIAEIVVFLEVHGSIKRDGDEQYFYDPDGQLFGSFNMSWYAAQTEPTKLKFWVSILSRWLNHAMILRYGDHSVSMA